MCSETYPNSTCVVAHALARSGERNRGTGQKARSGCGKARGTFVFRLHQDALANSRLDNGVLSFDIGATLNSYGEDVPGGSGRVCEGYAAFIYGFDMHRNVWLKMRNRVRDGYQTPYASAAHKRQSVRVVGGVVQLRGSSGSDAGGGGGGGGGGGADTSASPVKKRTRRGKEVEVKDLGRTSLMARAWMIEWGEKVGDKLPQGPDQPLPIFVFPTCDIGEVHRIFTLWCDARDMRDEYFIGLSRFNDVFKGCSQVRLSRKKGSFKGCSICLGRADALAKALPEEMAAIRVKYEVRFHTGGVGVRGVVVVITTLIFNR
jgi:hypothetical protein